MALDPNLISTTPEIVRTEFTIRDDAAQIREKISNLGVFAGAAGAPNNALVACFKTSATVQFTEGGKILNSFYFPSGLTGCSLTIYIEENGFSWDAYGYPSVFDDSTNREIGLFDYSTQGSVIGNTQFTEYGIYFDEDPSGDRYGSVSLRWVGDTPPARVLWMWLVFEYYSGTGQKPAQIPGAKKGDVATLPGDLTAIGGSVENLSAARVYCILDAIKKHDKQARLMWLSTAPNGRGIAHKSYTTHWIPVYDDCVLWHGLTASGVTRYSLQIGGSVHTCEIGVNKIELKKDKLSDSIKIDGVDYYPVRITELNNASTSVTAITSETAWITKE